MKNRTNAFATVAILLIAFGVSAQAEAMPIYDVQFTTNADGSSDYDTQTIDVAGGIVTYIYPGFRGRVFIQDPTAPAWGGIVVKDWTDNQDLANGVAIGDWVSLTNVVVEEYRNTTTLQYNPSWSPNVGHQVESTGNPIPMAMPLDASQFPYPANPALSEAYESMLVQIDNVTVGQKDLGKAGDNYELLQGADTAWATDYMNQDAGGPYDPRIQTGVTLESITGIVEQYTKPADNWDYYQLATRGAGDIVVPEPASLIILLGGVALLGRRRA